MPTSEQKIVKRVSELVAADSVSSPDPRWDSSNRKVISRLSSYAEEDGWSAEVQALDTGVDGKANLIATLGDVTGAGEEPAGLVLSGHTDTVPFDAQGWDTDPLQLSERDGRLYGLGSTDMKGFLRLHWRRQLRLTQKTLSRHCTFWPPRMKRARCTERERFAETTCRWHAPLWWESQRTFAQCVCTKAL